MVQAKHDIAAPTSRRNFIKSGAAVIAAMAVPALASAAPSVEAEIASLVAEFEKHDYKVVAIMDGEKPLGILWREPMVRSDWENRSQLAAFSKWLDFREDHKPEFYRYLIKTGRVEAAAKPSKA